MPRSCSICRFPEHVVIDGALIENEPLRDIAKRFSTTAASLHRHRQHLPALLINGKQAQVMANATTLLERVESLIQRLETIGQRAEEDRAWSSAAAAFREIRGCLTFLGQLTGELQVRASSNINLTVVSQRIQASLLAATPEEFGKFWKELLERATKEQKNAALAAAPPEESRLIDSYGRGARPASPPSRKDSRKS
jgi:hypothetical protein